MSDDGKIAEQLAKTRLGRESALYMAAIDCIKQTKTILHAAKLLAQKFRDANPWAAEMIGTAVIERAATAYIQVRRNEMRLESQKPTSGWTPADITAGENHTERASSGQGSTSPSRRGPIPFNRKGRTAFDTHRVAVAQRLLKGCLADSLLRTLKMSDGKLVATMAVRELRAYEKDGTLAAILKKKIDSKFAKYPHDTLVAEALNENEIQDCVNAAREKRLAVTS